MGDGASIHVEQTGNSKLMCDNASQSLKVNDVLVAPKMAKNLINGYKLTNDNSDVVIEIDSYGCFVKDKGEHKVLLQGVTTQGSRNLLPLAMVLVVVMLSQSPVSFLQF